MRAVKFLALALLLFAVFAGPAVAQDFTGVFRGGLQYVFLDGDGSFEIESIDDIDIKTDDAIGAYVGYEWRSKMFGLELGASYSEHDITGRLRLSKVSLSEDTKFRMYPITLALNFHVFGRSYVDFYLGPVVGYYFFSGGDADIDDEFGYGAQVGADWNLGGGFAINTALKYMILAPSVADVRGDYDLDPLSLQAGVAWRF